MSKATEQNIEDYTGETARSKSFFGKYKVRMALMLYDAIVIAASYFVAIWIRFDGSVGSIPPEYWSGFSMDLPLVILLTILSLWFFGCYGFILRYVSVSELLDTVIACFLAGVLNAGITVIVPFFMRMPVSYYFAGTALTIALCAVGRSISRIYRVTSSASKARRSAVNVMVIGAGEVGRGLVNEILRTSHLDMNVRCIIDDAEANIGKHISGIPVVGGRDCIPEMVKKYHVDQIIFAVAMAPAADRKAILEICQETGCRTRVVPAIYQLVNGEAKMASLREVQIEDLLGRDPIKTDLEGVYKAINGKTVLVTGGGGSIGSELCRQIAAHNPKRLIIFDIYENTTYNLQLELLDKYPDLPLDVIIGSVRDSRKVFEVFSKYRPQIVYHAAAHKHVPLMETSPCEAIKNNTIGTYKTAYAAMVNGCERFVLISTDKAVNPTNIMGASKRLCEMVIQSFDEYIKAGRADELPQIFTHEGLENADKDGTHRVFQNIKTQFVAVRFGNVLGSNGSVIPIFMKQIKNGGPVTVTHKDIIRYFMTIPEAVSLVMTAGTYAQGGEIFVLDMGEPVKIDTLARNLIRLSGYKPDVDIKIEYTGLRPGEKLYEEKLMAEEGLKKTANDLIHIGCPVPFDVASFLTVLQDLIVAAYKNNDKEVKRIVQETVATYHPADGGVPEPETETVAQDGIEAGA